MANEYTTDPSRDPLITVQNWTPQNATLTPQEDILVRSYLKEGVATDSLPYSDAINRIALGLYGAGGYQNQVKVWRALRDLRKGNKSALSTRNSQAIRKMPCLKKIRQVNRKIRKLQNIPRDPSSTLG